MLAIKIIAVCGLGLVVLLLNLGLEFAESRWAKWRLRRHTPRNVDLLKIAERHAAPQEWYDE